MRATGSKEFARAIEAKKRRIAVPTKPVQKLGSRRVPNRRQASRPVTNQPTKLVKGIP
jgi:hypothetical protein